MESMTSTENRQAQASDHAAAVARWDDEGGAPRSALHKNGAVKKRRRWGRIIASKQRNHLNLARPKR
jgi:hypothetical protein